MEKIQNSAQENVFQDALADTYVTYVCVAMPLVYYFQLT